MNNDIQRLRNAIKIIASHCMQGWFVGVARPCLATSSRIAMK